MDLNHLWFVLLGALLAGYAVLDGFDLGVGILHPAGRGDKERRLMINAIGPHWDGNEVWLVTFGGAMFAAFPNAYATVFSGFYTAFMLLLLALILRAVSIEFRGKRDAAGWRRFWDAVFFASSALATLLFGVAAGNTLMGIPVSAQGVYTGGFLDLLRPYPVLVGLLTVSLAAVHGALYLYLKADGELQERARRWIWRSYGAALVCYAVTTVFTLAGVPGAARSLSEHPWSWAVFVLTMLAGANIPLMVKRERPFLGFLSSSCVILGLVVLFSVSLYPNLVASSLSPEYSLTIYNAASSWKTLRIMAVIALIGMPLVVVYTAAIYWSFRGKVRITEHSY